MPLSCCISLRRWDYIFTLVQSSPCFGLA